MAKPQDVTGAGRSQEEAAAAIHLVDHASRAESERPPNVARRYLEFRGEI